MRTIKVNPRAGQNRLAVFHRITTECGTMNVSASLATDSWECVQAFVPIVELPVEVNGWYTMAPAKLLDLLESSSVCGLSIHLPGGMVLCEVDYDLPFQDWDGVSGRRYVVHVPLQPFGSVGSDSDAERLASCIADSAGAPPSEMRVSCSYDSGRSYVGVFWYKDSTPAMALLATVIKGIRLPEMYGAITVQSSPNDMRPASSFPFLRIDSLPRGIFSLNRYRTVYSVEQLSWKILRPLLARELALTAQERMLTKSDMKFLSIAGADYVRWPIASARGVSPSRGNCVKHIVQGRHERLEVSVASYGAAEPSAGVKQRELRGFLSRLED